MGNGRHPNAGVPIVILGAGRTVAGIPGMAGAARRSYAATDHDRIRKAVRDGLLRRSRESYHSVHVDVKRDPDGGPEALVAYMLRASTYTADVARLGVDRRFRVSSTRWDYDPEDDLGEAYGPPTGAGAAKGPKAGGGKLPHMVFGTPVPEIPSARAGVEHACKVARKAGYRVVKLLGKKASAKNYRKYLRGRLLAFGNIGHGFKGGIVLDDGILPWQWFDGLSSKAIRPEVAYFNSCLVFNKPLLPAVMKAGARTFVGGKTTLLIGDSEEVFGCFWTRVLGEGAKMGTALEACERKHYPDPGAHGVRGDRGTFRDP